MVHDAAMIEASLLALAFRELLAERRPVAVRRLADSLGLSISELEPVLASLTQRGRITRADDGAVSGSHGLSVEPTAHELRLNGERRWTWCAWDAVSILAALSADGVVVSRTPLGEPIELHFSTGRLPESDVVVFIPELDCSSVVDEWCPLANFFVDADSAAGWSFEHDVPGRVEPLALAAERGAEIWRRLLEEAPA